MLLASQAFGMRHGFAKVSLDDTRHRVQVPLHEHQVRDIDFSSMSGADLILTTSFDRTLKICDVRTENVVVSYRLGLQGWSCEWSSTDPNQMFCGTSNGSVLLFDLRTTTSFISKQHPRGGGPVHSLCHSRDTPLICADMGGVWGWDVAKEHTAALPIQAGACCSVSKCQTQGYSGSAEGTPPSRFLVSTRGASLASHVVFDLSAPTPGTEWTMGSTAGGNEALGSGACGGQWRQMEPPAKGHQSLHTLSRSILWEQQGGDLLIAAGDEASNQPWIWEASTGKVRHCLPALRSPVLDVSVFNNDGACTQGPASSQGQLFAAVSQGELMLYKDQSVDH
ncbi:unnamed protein product [Discosporangium mesarthrocarpum]